MAFLQHQAKAVWENKEYKGEKDYHVTNNELESGTGDVEKIPEYVCNDLLLL